MIKFAAIMAVVMHKLAYAAVPTSCFWCVSVGQIWNNIDMTCSMNGKGNEKSPQQCADLSNSYQGVGTISNLAFTPYAKYVDHDGQSNIPIENDESIRAVSVNITNLEDGLDLQLIFTCDSQLVVGYAISGDFSIKYTSGMITKTL